MAKISPALAKKLGDAKTSGAKGDRYKEGEYLCCVLRHICADMFSGAMFIPEAVVVEATKTGTEEPNRVGSVVSSAWPLDAAGKAGVAAQGNIKQYNCALAGIPVDDTENYIKFLSEASGDRDSDESLVARGMLFRVKMRKSTIQTGKNAGKEGCFPFFLHVPESEGNSAEEIAKRCRELDEKKL